MNFSIVIPCDVSRVNLLYKTLDKYSTLPLRFNAEFIIVTRSIDDLQNIWELDIKLIKYVWNEPTFSPAKALNIGVKQSSYDNIIITCPEVRPISDVLSQFNELGRGNFIAQVYDCLEDGQHSMSLVNSNFRAHPGMYFLAMYRKEDIEKINGWDNEFMYGYAYEDDDFGTRFTRNGNTFLIKDEITAEHLWHKRGSNSGDTSKDIDYSYKLYNTNIKNNVIVCKNGLKETEL